MFSTVDMQKIILLPKTTLKEHFFVSRLVVFNETFASVKEDDDFVARGYFKWIGCGRCLLLYKVCEPL